MSPLDSLSTSAQSAEVPADNAPSLQEQLFGQQDPGLASLQSALNNQASTEEDPDVDPEDPVDPDDLDEGMNEDPEDSDPEPEEEPNPLASLQVSPLDSIDNSSISSVSETTTQSVSSSASDQGLTDLHMAAEASRDPNLDVLDAAAKAAQGSQNDPEPAEFAKQGIPVSLMMALSGLSGGCSKASGPLVYIANVTINIGQ